jgi:ketosteroid isomerase-like protein
MKRVVGGTLRVVSAVAALVFVGACSSNRGPSTTEVTAELDSLNARVVQAYRAHDPQAYGSLYTDSAVFEWPAFTTVRGRAGMEAMARTNWTTLNDMDLRLTVASRRLAFDHATEFGAFEQSWRDSAGVRMTEFGRYVAFLVRQEDGSWRMDRFFGFADSTRPPSTRP